MDTTNLHPWIDVLTKVGEDDRLIAAVMISTDEASTIEAGTCHGTISLTAKGHEVWEEKPWRLCYLEAAASFSSTPEAAVSRAKLTPDGAPTDRTERESDMIAAVKGTVPKNSKESGRQPPLKDHKTWSKEKRHTWMLENLKLTTSPVLNTSEKVDRAVEFLDGIGTLQYRWLIW
jgi:hypothetical protein